MENPLSELPQEILIATFSEPVAIMACPGVNGLGAAKELYSLAAIPFIQWQEQAGNQEILNATPLGILGSLGMSIASECPEVL